MNITNLISAVKSINRAVVIPVNDGWHLIPPTIGSNPLQKILLNNHRAPILAMQNLAADQ